MKTNKNNNRRHFLRGAGAFLAGVTADRFFWGSVDQAFAKKLSYNFKPQKIALNSYCIFGKHEAFTMENGGDIVNISFIDTSDGVVVIDTGSSRRFGEALKAHIKRITGKPVIRVYNTHFHPDHVFGNQAFDPKTIAALGPCVKGMKEHGEGFSDGLYRILGDWMRGTEVVLPGKIIKQSSESFGGHKLELIPLKGHTDADLAIFDHKTGVLYAADLVFYERAATTPHAEINQWFKSLSDLKKIPYKTLLPGHGPLDVKNQAIDQTKDYLTWLDGYIKSSVGRGLDMIETAEGPIPKRFDHIDLVRYELERSVSHLYAKYEEKLLPLGEKKK